MLYIPTQRGGLNSGMGAFAFDTCSPSYLAQDVDEIVLRLWSFYWTMVPRGRALAVAARISAAQSDGPGVTDVTAKEEQA